MVTREPLKPVMAVLTRFGDSVKAPFSITKVYPNPFSNKVTVEFSVNTSMPIFFSIYDIKGNMVYQSKTQSYPVGANVAELAVENLKKGNYVLSMHGQNFSVSRNITRK